MKIRKKIAKNALKLALFLYLTGLNLNSAQGIEIDENIIMPAEAYDIIEDINIQDIGTPVDGSYYLIGTREWITDSTKPEGGYEVATSFDFQNQFRGPVINEAENLYIYGVDFLNFKNEDGSLLKVLNKNAVVNLQNILIDGSVKNAIINNGTLNFTNFNQNEDSYSYNEINSGIIGNGVININKNDKEQGVVSSVFIGNGANITQSAINVNGAEFDAEEGGKINAVVNITNDGIYYANADNILKPVNNESGSVWFDYDNEDNPKEFLTKTETLKQNITGNGDTTTAIHIKNEAQITQNALKIKRDSILGYYDDFDNHKLYANGKLTTNADNIKIKDKITNEGSLILTGGTNTNKITDSGEYYQINKSNGANPENAEYEYILKKGTTIIAGDVKNEGKILQDIEILDGAKLTTNVKDIDPNLRLKLDENGNVANIYLNSMALETTESKDGFMIPIEKLEFNENGELILKENEQGKIYPQGYLKPVYDYNHHYWTIDDEVKNNTTPNGNIKIANGGMLALNVDLDLTGENALYDTLLLGKESSGIITISDLKFKDEILKDFNAQILHAQNDNIELALSEELKEKYTKPAQIKTTTQTDSIKSDVNWKDEFQTKTIEEITQTKLELEQTNTKNDTIKYSTSTTTNTTTTSQGDNLALLNRFNSEQDRNYNFDSAQDIHKVSENLGATSKGKMNVNGVFEIYSGSEPEFKSNASTIDFQNQYTGFEVSNGVELNLNNINLANLKNTDGSALKITESGAVVNLNNVSIDKSDNAGIINNGTINFVNNTNSDLNEQVVNILDTSIKGTGTLNIKGNISALSEEDKELKFYNYTNIKSNEKINITQSQINLIDGAGLELSNIGKINAFINIDENSYADFNAGSLLKSVENNGDLGLHGGILSSNITGSGTTTIWDSEVTNNAIITQNVLEILKETHYDEDRNYIVDSQGSLITNADNLKIKDLIRNSGELTLTGGTIKNKIINEYFDIFSEDNNENNNQNGNQQGQTLSNNSINTLDVIDDDTEEPICPDLPPEEIPDDITAHSVGNYGTTIIAGDVKNEGKIAQSIEILNGATLTTHAKNLDTVEYLGMLPDGSLSSQFRDENGNPYELYVYSIKIAKDGKLNLGIDIDLTNNEIKYDSLRVLQDSDGIITISDLTFKDDVIKDFSAQILDIVTYDPDGTTIKIGDLQLALSDEIKNKYNGEKVEITQVGDDSMKADINWKDEINKQELKVTTTQKLELTQTNTKNDTLKYSQSQTSEVLSTSKGDNLTLLNRFETEDERNYNFDNADNIHTVSENLSSTTRGILNINGIAGEWLSDGNTNNDEMSTMYRASSTIDFDNKYTGFELNKTTTLNLKNLHFTNLKNSDGSLLNISNKDSIANLEGVIIDKIDSAGNNAIINDGTINFIAKNYTDEDGIITDSTGPSVLKSGISGTGTINIAQNATVDLSENTQITQDTINIDGYLSAYKAGKINASINVSETGIADFNANSITKAVKNDGDIDIANGTLTQDITGEGTTSISYGTVENKAKITQNRLEIEHQDPNLDPVKYPQGVLITNASNLDIKDKITNSGKLILTGGENNNLITNDTDYETGTDLQNSVTIIQGEVKNNAIIQQTVQIQSGNLTSSAENLQGSIFNNSNLTLNGTLNKAIQGQGTTIINNELKITQNGSIQGKLNLNNGILNLNDNSTNEINIGSAFGSGSLVLDLDLTGDSALSDTISFVQNNSIADILLSDINIIGNFDESKSFSTQIIKNSNSNTKLTLSENLVNNYTKNSENIISQTSDEIKQNVNWNDKFNSTIEKELISTKLEVTGSSKGLKDTIQYSVNKEIKTEQTSNGDALALINQTTKFDETERTFNANSSKDTYILKEELGTTSKGTLTINGQKDNESISTIDLNNKKGFNLVNETTLNVNDTKITNAKDNNVINIENENATVNLKNAFIDGNIVSKGDYNLSVKGSSTIKGSVGNATTTLENANLAFSSDTFKDATLDLKSGSINLQDNKAQVYNINSLTTNENVEYSIDIDLSSNPVSDVFKVNSGSGVIKLSDINFINSPDLKEEFTLKVIDSNSSIKLALDDSILNQTFDVKVIGQEVSRDEVKADMKWNQNKIYSQTGTAKGNITLTSTTTQNDSISLVADMSSADYTNGEKIATGTFDSLSALNALNTSDNKNFTFDSAQDTYKVQENFKPATTGTLNINGISQGQNLSTIDGGGYELFNSNEKVELNINNTKITNAKNAINLTNTDSVINLNNAQIKDNTQGIQSAGTLNINSNTTISNNNDGIKLTSSTANLNINGNSIKINDKITGTQGAKLNIKNADVEFSKEVKGVDIDSYNAEVKLLKDNILNNLNTTFNNSSLNLANANVSSAHFNSLNLKSDLNLAVDVDLANKAMDTISADNYNLNDNMINVNKMNMLSDAKETHTTLAFAPDEIKENITTSVKTTAYSPIWKYDVTYDKENGNFDFIKGANQPLTSSSAYNPAVMASPVSAQVGSYTTQIRSYEEAFQGMNQYMLLPYKQRLSLKMQNKYALLEGSAETITQHHNAWLKPYTIFENVALKNGPKVSNIAYGTFFGDESPIKEIGKGWDASWGAYAGYNGARQTYDGTSVTQNGTMLGLNASFYKHNFFTGLTLNSGVSFASANTMFGDDNFTMFTTGVASKSGYNFEFNDGKFILQPNMLFSYSFINTFDYTNSQGVKISSDPLHALQLEPGIKLIGNFENGWQPYLDVSMIWNLMNKTHFLANNTSLPQLSIKPYVKYGLGVKKSSTKTPQASYKPT